jgi:hypothetical protein
MYKRAHSIDFRMFTRDWLKETEVSPAEAGYRHQCMKSTDAEAGPTLHPACTAKRLHPHIAKRDLKDVNCITWVRLKNVAFVVVSAQD